MIIFKPLKLSSDEHLDDLEKQLNNLLNLIKQHVEEKYNHLTAKDLDDRLDRELTILEAFKRANPVNGERDKAYIDAFTDFCDKHRDAKSSDDETMVAISQIGELILDISALQANIVRYKELKADPKIDKEDIAEFRSLTFVDNINRLNTSITKINPSKSDQFVDFIVSRLKAIVRKLSSIIKSANAAETKQEKNKPEEARTPSTFSAG